MNIKAIKKDDCCGCSSCFQICNKKAIIMKDEGYGFKFPYVNSDICINCGLCYKSCPLNNLTKRNINASYLCVNNDINVRKKSSSGGIFYSIAKYVLNNKGIVFGASFDKNFNVIIKYVESLKDIDDLMRSKYVQADTLNTYNECKDFLNKGRLVLYTGTPCQINGLKTFLNKDYTNLITVDVACHGVPSQGVWKTYINELRKNGEIESINFRDKRNGWKDYNFTVKYKDGNEFTESHSNNKFMNLFLSDKILRKSCYNCDFKNEFSKSDITISDFWGYTGKHDNNGLSGIVVQTEKGRDVIDKLGLIIENANYTDFCKKNGGFKNIIKLPDDRLKILKSNIKKEKIGVITLRLNSNIGGELQAYALQHYLINNGYDCELIEINNPKHLDFVDKYIKRNVINSFSEIKESDYNTIIVGSDQIWRIKYTKQVNHNFLDFAEKWKNVNKIAYSASFGSNEWEYNKEQTNKAKELIKQFNKISVREDNGVELCKKFLNSESEHTCDPTMLLSKDEYIKLINENNLKNKKNVIFTYFLDENNEKISLIDKSKNYLKCDIINHDKKSVIDWLNCFNSCRCVVTDSFHGCVFSIIFNKPFICIINKERGNARFTSLINNFPKLKNRFINDITNVDFSLLNEQFNIEKEKNNFIGFSKNYLINSL